MSEVQKVEIRLDAKEILDHVDDMLAWEAIASAGSLGLRNVAHMYRAEPMVRLGPGAYGILTPKSLEAFEIPASTVAYDYDVAIQQSAEFCNKLAEDLPPLFKHDTHRHQHFAVIVEHEKKDYVPSNESGVASATTRGDDVSDLITRSRAGGGSGYSGVRYHLHTIGELNEKSRRFNCKRLRLPETARIYQTQDVHMFADGRSSIGDYWFVFWGGKFRDLKGVPLNKTPEALEYGGNHPSLANLLGLHESIVRRRSQWNVELSLTKSRSGVALQTDALGARELVNALRAAGSASGRRKALVHWVDEHMRRRSRLDDDATIKVAAHLRGIHGLEAGRYYARIWPATDAIEAAKNGARFDHARAE